MQNAIEKLIKKNSEPKLISDVFEFAKEAYKDKYRFSGENYINHALRVATMLNEMGLDPTTVAFALLHDVLDDIPDSAKQNVLQMINKKFGEEISILVKSITELSKIRYPLMLDITNKKNFSKDKIENTRRMFLAIAGDLRVVLVELISRLDGLNFLQNFSEDKQKLYSFETFQIFVPIANRLGLSEIRRKLEDNSFRFLFPEKFNWLKEEIKEEYEERQKYLKKFILRLNKIFKKERVKAIEINYRAKSYWSTYRKLLRHDMDFKKIHDLFALRIILDDVSSCYRVLGIIHKHFKPISEEINDYIAKPKLNGYRSLHTTILSDENKITEIQIRTSEMHKEAEYGICAHWSYKEKIDLIKDSKNFEWIKNIPEFWKTFKINFFEDKVFALTPKGDIIVLRKDSTSIDFAYAIHSEIGDHCESVKINGKITTLSDKLKNGDIVEIITNKRKSPSQDWLRFVKTSLAESQIKKALAQKEISFKSPITNFIKRKFVEIKETVTKKRDKKQKIKKEQVRHIYLAGEKGMLINIAKCCKPEPGDKVKAYLTLYRSAVLHRVSCKNFQKLAEKFPDRVIDASWK
jgi:RelA/SpoT family (p)ppGpp synthetase